MHGFFISNDSMTEKLLTVKRYIECVFCESISLNELAGVACLNKYSLVRAYKKKFQISPYQYIIKLRLTQSEELLLTTQMRINEISDAIGFADVRNFIKTFNKKNGLPPEQFRKQQLKKMIA